MMFKLVQLYFAVSALGLAILYEFISSNSVLQIALAWEAGNNAPVSAPKRILVGVNANLDMVVLARDLLVALGVNSTEPHAHSFLSSSADLEQVVSYSMLHCVAIERTFVHKSIFRDIVSVASSIPHTYHVGGNAALIAQKMKSTNREVEVMLVAPMGKRLKRLLRDDIIIPKLSKNVAIDEVHMILEFSAGTRWDHIQSSCANRVIFSHDNSNSKMVALEDIKDSVNQFKPDLAVLSGAHLLGDQPQEVWRQRLNDTAKILESTLKPIPVHWELASIGNMQFFQQMAETLFPRIESLGMNEQELLSVAKSSGAPFNFFSIPQKPGIDWVSDILHWLMQRFSLVNNDASTLTRVHLHSLSFHLVAIVESGPWHNNKQAVIAGAKVAGLQACNTSTFNSNQFKLLNPEEFRVTRTSGPLSKKLWKSKAGYIEWSRSGIHYFFSPVLVCNNPLKTVGLGDAISAVGLLNSEFYNNN